MSMTLIELQDDALVAVCCRLKQDDMFAASLSCTALRNVLREEERWQRKTTYRAATASIPRAMWALENGCDANPVLCEFAAERGQLEVLQWLRTNGCEWDMRTCTAAVYGCHLLVLQWARTNGCEWDWDTCYETAKHNLGAIRMLARRNGCEWDEWTCADAARSGNQEYMSFDDSTRTFHAFAVEHDYMTMLQWLRVNCWPYALHSQY